MIDYSSDCAAPSSLQLVRKFLVLQFPVFVDLFAVKIHCKVHVGEKEVWGGRLETELLLGHEVEAVFL